MRTLAFFEAMLSTPVAWGHPHTGPVTRGVCTWDRFTRKGEKGSNNRVHKYHYST
jgi:hypothetical protein